MIFLVSNFRAPHIELERTATFSNKGGVSYRRSSVHFIVLFKGRSLDFGLAMIVAVPLFCLGWLPRNQRGKIIH